MSAALRCCPCSWISVAQKRACKKTAEAMILAFSKLAYKTGRAN
jgi:hypothetical protein